MKAIRLTDLELKIMKVMWDKDKHLTIQEIANSIEGLSVPSVTQAMKHLISKKAVTVAEHILVSNVYARAFVPCYTADEYIASENERLTRYLLGEKNDSK